MQLAWLAFFFRGIVCTLDRSCNCNFRIRMKSFVLPTGGQEDFILYQKFYPLIEYQYLAKRSMFEISLSSKMFYRLTTSRNITRQTFLLAENTNCLRTLKKSIAKQISLTFACPKTFDDECANIAWLENFKYLTMFDRLTKAWVHAAFTWVHALVNAVDQDWALRVLGGRQWVLWQNIWSLLVSLL